MPNARSRAAPSDSSCRTMVSVAGAPAACCILLSSLMVILQFLVVAAAFAVIDAIWLKTMNPFYRGQIGELLAERPNLGYAVVFYVTYIAGIVFFACVPRSTASARSCGWSGSALPGRRAR
nr:DUF2177 family protein [Arthrobacter sp. ISL-72]